jgi:hypothetical protein
MLGSVDGAGAVYDGHRSNSRDERREPLLICWPPLPA